jgi:hypothetical protein
MVPLRFGNSRQSQKQEDRRPGTPHHLFVRTVVPQCQGFREQLYRNVTILSLHIRTVPRLQSSNPERPHPTKNPQPHRRIPRSI